MYPEHIGVSSPYHLSTLPFARGRSWMALVVRVGRGSGWRRRGDNRTERQDSRRESSAGGIGRYEGEEGGQGVRVRPSRASQSHSRSSTTVPHDPQSDPTTASVYRRHPHSQQPLAIPSNPRKVAQSYARPLTGFRSVRKSLLGG